MQNFDENSNVRYGNPPNLRKWREMLDEAAFCNAMREEESLLTSQNSLKNPPFVVV